MEFQELIEKRRSIRKYSTDGKVSRGRHSYRHQSRPGGAFLKNSQTGRYYCILSEDMTERFREECLRSLTAQNRRTQRLLSPLLYVTGPDSRKTDPLTMNWATAGAAMIWDSE